MLQLKNDFIMAPVKLGYSDETGVVTDKHRRFYRERSVDVGAVTLEPLAIAPGLREIPTQLGISTEKHVAGLRGLVAEIHLTGARVIAHINHPGRLANPTIPGNYFVSATDTACENGGATPTRLDAAAMERERRLLVDAAVRAERAGFDVIELQMGHGYLLAQFLSPAVNDRTDEYGGSLQNRMRYPLEVYDAIREAVSVPMVVRISGDEMTPDGIHIDEMITLGEELKAREVAAVHVSAGTGCSTPPWFFQHMFVPKGKTWDLAERFRSATGIPTIFVGRVHSREDVRRLREEYGADYIAAGRALVADPSFFRKISDETAVEPIRPCLACSEGCLGGVKSGQGLTCVVNPTAGHDDAMIKPAAESKRIAVVGGGLAGMQSALTLKQRGHAAELFERDRLGGQFNLAHLPPHKESLKELIDYYEYELRRASIPVHEKEATVDEIVADRYDAVVVATGATPMIPPIPGLEEYWWAESLQRENIPEGRTILVIGGGLIGIEIAAKMVEANNRVTIVEMFDEVARGMEMIERSLSLKYLKTNGVPIYTGNAVKEITTEPDGTRTATIEDRDGARRELTGIDHVVLAAGMRSDTDLAERFKDRSQDRRGDAPAVHVVGDAKKVGKAQTAIRDAFLTAARV